MKKTLTTSNKIWLIMILCRVWIMKNSDLQIFKLVYESNSNLILPITSTNENKERELPISDGYCIIIFIGESSWEDPFFYQNIKRKMDWYSAFLCYAGSSTVHCLSPGNSHYIPYMWHSLNSLMSAQWISLSGTFSKIFCCLHTGTHSHLSRVLMYYVNN